jgi:type 1 glutamine amidotransferase
MSLSPAALGDASSTDHEKLSVLIVDGHNPYHDWQTTTPLLRRILESSGRFEVDVATAPVPVGYRSTTTAPPPPVDNSGFRPRFADYDVVLGNYVGPRWPAETEQEFVAFVAGGHGYVAVHAADNAFPDWPEYNRICGVGGWYGRNERWGPYLYYDGGDQLQRDTSTGGGGHHGPQHEYQLRIRDTEHPITRGLPTLWMHTKDELYDSLRGPAEDLHVLATAYSDPRYEGTGRHEPMLMTLSYGAGRVFHTVLGHADYSMKCAGFVTTLRRGTEWAATGEVTLGMVDDFPSADESSTCDSDECLSSGRAASASAERSQSD